MPLLTLKCKWCGRDAIPLTKKGSLKPHLTPGGQRCLVSGLRVADDSRTQPKRR